MRVEAPRGYSHFAAGAADVVVRDELAGAVRAALGAGTLYEWALAQPDARRMRGRLPAVAVTLPFGGPRAVVRRSHHGGLLAPLLGDRFVTPTRAPYELLASMVLERLEVPTASVLAIAMYPAGPLLRRSDVVTRELLGRDVAALAAEGSASRQALLAPVAALLRRLSAAGVWHPDLNLRNVLVTADGDGSTAYVLDIDSVRFEAPGDARVGAANLERFERSARKLRRLEGGGFDEAELSALRSLVAGGAA
jgi:3-deoxy-D-manno-octulosonic acid kinase